MAGLRASISKTIQTRIIIKILRMKAYDKWDLAKINLAQNGVVKNDTIIKIRR